MSESKAAEVDSTAEIATATPTKVESVEIDLISGEVSAQVEMEEGQEGAAMEAGLQALIDMGVIQDPNVKKISPKEESEKCELDPRSLINGEDGVKLGESLDCAGCKQPVVAGYQHPKSGRSPQIDLCQGCWEPEWFIDGVCVECGGDSPMSL